MRVRDVPKSLLLAWEFIGIAWIIFALVWLVVHFAFWLSDVLVWSV